MNVSPDPITAREEAARERENLLDFFARGLCCAVAHRDDPGEEALTKAKAVADDYLSAYEEWMVQLAAHNASEGPTHPDGATCPPWDKPTRPTRSPRPGPLGS